MSQETVSHIIRRTCDGCKKITDWDFTKIDEKTIKEMEEWYTVIREVYIEGQFAKMMVQACSLSCIPAAAVKLALKPQMEEGPDQIDLASLRAPKETVN